MNSKFSMYHKGVVTFILIFCSAFEVLVDSEAIQTACQHEWNLVGNKCYFFSNDRKNYQQAKEFCERLEPSGRLYVPLNETELTPVAQEAARHISHQYIMLGVDEAELVEGTKTWYWGSGQKITSPWCTSQPNQDQNQNNLIVTRNYQHCLHDDTTSWARPFICQEAQGLTVSKREPTSLNDSKLFDFNIATCINSTEALHPLGFYILELVIPHKLNHGTVIVWFNQTVDCKKRQVINTWKLATACRSGGYLKSCDLLTAGSTSSTSCEYRCPCAEDGCKIVLVDDAKQQEQETGDICEITYQN